MDRNSIINEILPFVEKNGRKLDYLLIRSLFEKGLDKEILFELLKYRNEDGGFGNALEPDAHLPQSSVLATNVAVSILKDIVVEEDIIKGIIEFYISKFDSKTETFEFLPESVNDYPRAIWWNFDIKEEVNRFNPTPEVLGFILKNKHLTDFNIVLYVDNMIKDILARQSEYEADHSLYSVIRFYDYLDETKQTLIVGGINSAIRKAMVLDESKWKEYVPQPFNFIVSKDHNLYEEYESILNKNLEYLIQSCSENSVWYPSWEWYQFSDIFNSTTRNMWMGYLTYEKLKVLIEFKKIKGL